MSVDDPNKKDFFKYIFNFDDDSKADVLNIIQYSMMSIIPVTLLIQAIGKYAPDVDDTKGSLEIIMEILAQIVVTFLFLVLIHRFVTYFPTYSNGAYPEYSVVSIVLAVLLILLSLQTKLGEKVNIIVDRIHDAVIPPSPPSQNKKVKVISPGSSGSDNGTTSIDSLPNGNMTNVPPQLMMQQQQQQQQQQPQQQQQQQPMDEPMAANSAFGGFGSSW